MENEKKNTPTPEQKSGNSGNHRSKHRSNKHKSYFITPGGEQSAPEHKHQQNNQQPAQKKAEGANGAPNQKNHNRHNNHHKHKKNPNPQAKDEQRNQTSAEPQVKTADAPKTSAENAPADSAPKHNNNHQRNNKRKHHNDKRREERQTTADNQNSAPKSADTLTESGFVPMPKSSDRLQKSAPQKLTKFSDSPEFEKYSDYEEYSFEELYGKLKEECTAEIDERMTSELTSRFPGKQIASVFILENAEKQETRAMILAVVSLLLVFIIVSITLINNSVTAQIREGKRTIGTLRAVGASQKELINSYIVQIMSMLLWGLGTGIVGYIVSYNVMKLFMYDYFPIVLWPVGAVVLILFLACYINLYAKIKQEMKHSIVENIRELG